MYNRYIPQPDGSFRRNRIPDSQTQTPPPIVSTPISEEKQSQETQKKPDPPCRRQHHAHTAKKNLICNSHREEVSISSFLRKLLPKEFDTGDLMIVLLLLLMAGDCTDDQNTALLTLALYFFM